MKYVIFSFIYHVCILVMSKDNNEVTPPRDSYKRSLMWRRKKMEGGRLGGDGRMGKVVREGAQTERRKIRIRYVESVEGVQSSEVR